MFASKPARKICTSFQVPLLQGGLCTWPYCSEVVKLLFLSSGSWNEKHVHHEKGIGNINSRKSADYFSNESDCKIVSIAAYLSVHHHETRSAAWSVSTKGDWGALWIINTWKWSTLAKACTDSMKCASGALQNQLPVLETLQLCSLLALLLQQLPQTWCMRTDWFNPISNSPGLGTPSRLQCARSSADSTPDSCHSIPSFNSFNRSTNKTYCNLQKQNWTSLPRTFQRSLRASRLPSSRDRPALTGRKLCALKVVSPKQHENLQLMNPGCTCASTTFFSAASKAILAYYILQKNWQSHTVRNSLELVRWCLSFCFVFLGKLDLRESLSNLYAMNHTALRVHLVHSDWLIQWLFRESSFVRCEKDKDFLLLYFKYL